MPAERRIEQVVQLTAVVLLALGCLVVLKPFLGAVIGAGILCFSTWPIYSYVERKVGGRRWLASLLMTLLIIVVLVLPLTLIALTLRDDVPVLMDRIREVLEGGLPQPPAWVKSIPLFGDQIDAAWRELTQSREQFAEALKRFAQ